MHGNAHGLEKYKLLADLHGLEWVDSDLPGNTYLPTRWYSKIQQCIFLASYRDIRRGKKSIRRYLNGG